ncbi:GerAB/ArcD/ProY family transporter [Paenibacillus sp. UNC451MF]|uniref:GerAB/ArcD/ProY family transporter n=1 Tax=Paenibacillus sp. UNC451MF TaxID=1449063 RepID=UPI0012DC5265|nr:endospore germination permease [Paenibacillus sp. UNC451MF]
MTKSINIIQIIMIIMASVGLFDHVILIPVILDIAGRDAWISTVFTALPFMVWILIIYWIMKRSGQQPLLEWVQETAGRSVSLILRISFIICYMFVVLITVKDTVTWAASSYLPETPMILLSLLLVCLCYFSARSGINSIAITAGILLPFIVILGFFVMSANIPNKDYSRLLPVMEYGVEPLLRGMIYAGSGFSELFVILMFQHHISHKMRWWQLVLLGFIITILTLGPITGSIAEFGPVESAKHRYPAFEQWRLVVIHQYIERVDFFSIYQWFAGAFVRVSLSMYILGELSPFKGKTNKSIFLMLLSVVILFITNLPIGDIVFYDWLKYIYLPYSLVAYLLLTCILCVVAFMTKKRRLSA